MTAITTKAFKHYTYSQKWTKVMKDVQFWRVLKWFTVFRFNVQLLQIRHSPAISNFPCTKNVCLCTNSSKLTHSHCHNPYKYHDYYPFQIIYRSCHWPSTNRKQIYFQILPLGAFTVRNLQVSKDYNCHYIFPFMCI